MHERINRAITIEDARENLALEFAFNPDPDSNGVNDCLETYKECFENKRVEIASRAVLKDNNMSNPELDVKTYLVWSIDLLQNELDNFIDSLLEKQGNFSNLLVEEGVLELFDEDDFISEIYDRYDYYVEEYKKGDYLEEFDQEISFLHGHFTKEAVINLSVVRHAINLE